jgi:hypothetical protein
MSVSDQDITYLRRAIQLAREAERNGNLPIGALVCLDGEIVGEGRNSICRPTFESSSPSSNGPATLCPPNATRCTRAPASWNTNGRD